MHYATPTLQRLEKNPPPAGANSPARPGRFLAAALLLLCLAGPEKAFAGDLDDVHLTANFGTGYSNGSYGTNRNTDVLLGLTSLTAAYEDFKFTVSIPYMRISGRGLVVFDAAGNPIVINRRTDLPADVRSGWGDVNLSATYAIPPSVLDDFEVKFTGRVKLPTASERRRLSTGRTDFGMSVDVSRDFGIWGPFVTIGYLIPSQFLTYRLYNTLSFSAGTSVVLDSNLIGILSYDRDSPSTPLVGNSEEMSLSLSWLANDRITLTGYGTAGLSSGSPEVGAGLLISYGLN